MKKITLDSKISDIYEHPIGRDIIKRILLQMNLSDFIIDNSLIGSRKLSTIAKLTRFQLGDSFFDTLINMLNHETDAPSDENCESKHTWWKEASFYQIYPRSFCDTNGDHIGDLNGILKRLDYIMDLGIDAIWLSPIYDSPNDDNGYDIRDYRKIWDGFGTMEDFDKMLEGIHSRGMKLIMDLVVNHTSDEHEWFQSALKDKNSPYSDYYFFRKGKGKNPPNNWTSFFGGSAWKYYEERDEWALHLFSQKQMDLNWENEALRKDIIDMIRWWLDKGVDGFRMDVINYISKAEGLPDGEKKIGKLMGFCGIEHYFYGPKLHAYLKEIQEKAFSPYHAFSVGETPGIGMEMSKLLTGDDRGELDMVFSFDHLENPGHVRFDDYLFNLNYLKKYYINWMQNYGNHCWMSLFLENHDNPRMISKVEKDETLHLPLAELLLILQFTLKGTPFVYQGQELATPNQKFECIEDFSDVESINLYHELIRTGSEQDAFRIVLSGSRDHARAMMDWMKASHSQVNETSMHHFCKNLIKLRKSNYALLYGEINFIHPQKRDFFAFTRESGGKKWYIECNLSRHELRRPSAAEMRRLVISNYNLFSGTMQPYEACIFQVTKS